MPKAEWKVLIADDEPAARRGVRQLLDAYPDFHVLAECRNGSELLEVLETVHADVVFLDVQMPGLGGFDVILERTPERMPATVFLTAYDEFALKAFEAEALDYLVKPVTEQRFAATMRRLERQLNSTKRLPADSGVLVTTSRGSRVLKFAEIDWIEAADNYSRLWVGTRNYLLREALASLEPRAQAAGFVRVHRQALVRLSGVRQLVTSDSETFVVLESGVRVAVARRRRASFVRALGTRGR